VLRSPLHCDDWVTRAALIADVQCPSLVADVQADSGTDGQKAYAPLRKATAGFALALALVTAAPGEHL
jgi:hypothetical protein